MTGAADALRPRAERLAKALPPLLLRAERLASGIQAGFHGRRRAGRGDEFWQYRPAHPGDSARMIDWRRSARTDSHFVREKEWQLAQTVWLWVDPGASMAFASSERLPSKFDRAALVTMALAILLDRAGERVGLAGPALIAPGIGNHHLGQIATALSAHAPRDDYALPDLTALPDRARVVLISDFLTPVDALLAGLSSAAGREMALTLIEMLDPAEEQFPFRGRVIFESARASLRHETLRADALAPAYRERLAARRQALGDIARHAGWAYGTEHTDRSAGLCLLWAWQALGRGAAWQACSA